MNYDIDDVGMYEVGLSDCLMTLIVQLTMAYARTQMTRPMQA